MQGSSQLKGSGVFELSKLITDVRVHTVADGVPTLGTSVSSGHSPRIDGTEEEAAAVDFKAHLALSKPEGASLLKPVAQVETPRVGVGPESCPTPGNRIG